MKWLFEKCDSLVRQLRARSLDENEPEWAAIAQKLEVDFITDAYKRELSYVVLLDSD